MTATHNKTTDMAKDKVALPMLEAFLSEAKPPSGNVLPEWIDWPLAIFALVCIASLKKGSVTDLLSLGAAGAIIYGFRMIRQKQLEAQPAAFQVSYERWKRVSLLQKVAHDKKLHKKVPGEVLASLERAARTWHEVRESLSSVAITDPDFALQGRDMVDAAMMSAASAARPVVLKEDQYRKDLERLEADIVLLSSVCQRIDQEEARMRLLLVNPIVSGPQSHDALFSQLERARAERAQAEAELNELLP